MRGMLVSALIFTFILAKCGGQQPKVVQLVMEALVGNHLQEFQWRDWVADDTDIDKDGEISEREVEVKFNEYMATAFKIMDQNADGSVTGEELESLGIDLEGAKKIWNMVLESYPLKYWIRSFDLNENDFLDRADFDLLNCNENPRTGRCPLGREDLWEKYGKYILIADKNEDEQISFEEIRNKSMDCLQTMFNLADQNDNGEISINDINEIRIAHSEIMEIFEHAFEIIDKGTNGENEINIAHDVPVLGKYVQEFDLNADGKITIKDAYMAMEEKCHPGSNRLLYYNLAQISKNVDKNQNGILHHDEIMEFVKRVLKVIDRNNNTYVDEEDAYAFIQDKHDSVPEFEIESIKDFVRGLKDFVKSEFSKLANKILEEVDEDGNGAISQEELNNVRVPCMIQGECRDKAQFRFDYPASPPPDLRFSYKNHQGFVASILDDPAL